MRSFLSCIVVLLMFSPLVSRIPAQQLNNLPDIEAILGDDGRFLSPPLDITEVETIGLIIPQALDKYGMPQRLFSVRGEVAWQDDVVFFYNDFMYLYWFQDRVWQVRFDYRYKGSLFGVKMGQTSEELVTVLGAPHYAGEGSLFYDVRDRGFPVRVRLFFDEGLLHDIYIYRSDF